MLRRLFLTIWAKAFWGRKITLTEEEYMCMASLNLVPIVSRYT